MLRERGLPMEKLMLRLVRTARKALNADEKLREIGYETTPYWDIYCEIFDAIYEMLGEETDTADSSITHAVLNADTLNDEQRVLILVNAFNKKNRPAL